MPVSRVAARIKDNLEIRRQLNQLDRLGVVIWDRVERSDTTPVPPLIVAHEVTVTDPGEYENIFREGDKVLELHFQADNARDMITLFRDLMGKLPAHKRAGYAGFYGDTPVTPIISHGERIDGVTVIDSPPEAAERTRETYHLAVTKEGYPAEYDGKPVKRLVMRITD